MNKYKKYNCLAISIIVILISMLTNCNPLFITPAYAATTKSWNFSNANLKDLGIISSTTTIDGLKVIASGDKTMSVISSAVTYNAANYTHALSMGGAGSSTYRALSFDVSGSATIKITAKSNGSDTRYLKIVNAAGTELGTIDCTSSVTGGSVSITGNQTVYIYSGGSGINIYQVQLDSADILPEESVNSTTVTTFADLVTAAKTMSNKSGGGIVYINAKSLDCTAQLALSSTTGNAVGIVGIQQSDGTYPVLNFTSLRTSKIGSSGGTLKDSGDDSVGVRITGSNYTVKNLIIEKAPDNGIQIKGSKANNNTVENCILRYNNDAGLQITGGASFNTIRFVYSYRNCDIYTRGGNSDGFAPKLGATTGNTFYGCYSWENSDDGWDSFDKTDSGYTNDLSYEESACWNNGNPEVFTGKYDYDNGKPLDTNLFLVELITKQDSSFASNYIKGSFNLPAASFIKTDAGTISASSWIGTNYGGNPNGFKFGSVNSGSDLTRTVKNCLSFGHKNKGFDNNNSSCTGYFNNTVSFDNGYNYALSVFTLSKWTNIYGFSGSSGNKLPTGFSASTPSSSSQSAIRSTVTSTVNKIVSSCNKNIIPGEVYFDIYN